MKSAPVRKENGSHSVGHGMNMKHKHKHKHSHSKPSADTPPGGSSGEKSHLQLFQGARELTQMIDSLSKAPSLDWRSKDIAKDLLRGAQDLQSSLAMLAKLQEASESDVSRPRVEGRHEELGMRRTARSKRFVEEVERSRRFGPQEHKSTPSRQRPEFLKQGMGAGEVMVSERFGSRKSSRYGAEEMKTVSRLKFNQRFECVEEGRSSGEPKRMSGFKLKQGSEYNVEEEEAFSVDTVEELRRVIKDGHGLSRQNLLPRPSDDGEFDSRRRPRVDEHRYERKERPKQAKAPNVIAKLMGLEETEDEMRKKKKKSSLITPRPAFDIDDKPKARKMQAAETTTPDPRQKSLHEIIAALQFKGLLKSGRGEDFKRTICEVGVPKSNSKSFNEEEEEDVPPIVIMKPLFLPHWQRGEVKSTEETSAQVSPMANARTTVAQKLQGKKASSNSSKKADEGRKLLLNVKKGEKYDAEKKISQMKPETKNSTSVAKEKKKKKKKAAKSISKSTDNKTKDEHCEDGKRSNIQRGKDLFSKNSTSTVHDLSEGGHKQAKPCIQDGKQENFCEMMRKTTTTRVASEVEEDLMCLLLSSRSFINHAKELFLINAHHHPVHYKRKGIGEDVMRNAKLYLDCGKELMARKSNQIVKKYSLCSSSVFPSLTQTQLAEEISSVIETMVSYSQIDDNLISEENLYLRLERDLRSKDMMASANWDIGWTDWVCTEESSRIVGELEEFILGWLLTEVAQDLGWL